MHIFKSIFALLVILSHMIALSCIPTYIYVFHFTKRTSSYNSSLLRVYHKQLNRLSLGRNILAGRLKCTPTKRCRQNFTVSAVKQSTRIMPYDSLIYYRNGLLLASLIFESRNSSIANSICI